MRAGRPIVIAVGLGLLCPATAGAGAGVTISDFRDGPDEFMEGSVLVSDYGPCPQSDTDGCFDTYLYGFIRADDGSCPTEQGNLAVSANLPRDGSKVTAAVDGDPAVRGWNRLCAYIERVYWSGARSVIAQGSAVAYSKGPAPDGDQHDCSDFPERTAAQGYLDDWPSDSLDLDPDADGLACNDGSYRQRLSLGPGAPLPRARAFSLSAAEARRQTTRVLKRVFRRSFGKRGFSRKCRRRTRASIACRVAWSSRTGRFDGKVSIRKVGRRRYRYSLHMKVIAGRSRPRLVRRSGSL